ncbi:MAG TPA: energy transducer TonB [Terriglobia bacterium]|nr:energy transducer TonB [Terriglobia bacterium]
MAVPVAEARVPEAAHPVSTSSVVQRALAQPIRIPPSQPPSRQSSVHTGLFGGAAQPVIIKRPLEAVQTGGFGDPHGLPGRGQGDTANDVPRLGSFALPEGGGKGDGTGGDHGVQGVVASAGFGSGVAGGGTAQMDNGTGKQAVSLGGFTKAARTSLSAGGSLQPAPAMDFQPVEILSKSDPLYTEEGRRLGVQGDVKLSVVFQSNGVIHIMGVVKSLGHGLDQAAEQAASQIRFKPAQRDGKPVDFPAILRIEFRLAGQSS